MPFFGWMVTPYFSPIRRTRALATTGLALFLVAAFVATPARASAPPPSGLGLAAAPAGSAEITYRKIFKTSYPEFVEIKINEAGAGTYDIRQLDEDANPQPFEIGAPLVERIFRWRPNCTIFKAWIWTCTAASRI